MTREEAIEYLEKLYMMADITDEYGYMDDTEPYETAIDMAVKALSDAPDINVGKWIYGYSDRICSICNASFDDEIVYMCKDGQLNFCPNCGAKMMMMESDD